MLVAFMSVLGLLWQIEAIIVARPDLVE